MDFKRISVAAVGTAALAVAPGVMAQSMHFGVFGGISSFDVPQASLDSELVALTQVVLAPPANTPVDVDSNFDDGAAWGVQVGYNFNSWVAIELGFTDLGNVVYEADVYDASISPRDFLYFAETKYSSSGPSLAVLGTLPLNDRFDLHGRAGIFFSDTRVSYHIDEEELVEYKASGKDLILGIGASWKFKQQYALRLEWQRFLDVGDEEETGEEDVDLVALTFLFR